MIIYFRSFHLVENIPLSFHKENGENGQNVTIYLQIPLFNAIGFIRIRFFFDILYLIVNSTMTDANFNIVVCIVCVVVVY